jgi:putative pyruvate formate lyase activating enzyme
MSIFTYDEHNCKLCPRECGANRALKTGACGAGNQIRIAKYYLHPFEEPCISFQKGSGTIFFSGCSLGCVFCQNRSISREPVGVEMDRTALAAAMLSLQEKGAHNVNLVTATHFADRVAEALSDVKGKLHIPVVYNSSGYERVET